MQLASTAILKTEAAMGGVEGVLADTLFAAAKATVKQLRRQLRSAADEPSIKGFEFDETNPDTVKWIRDHAAELIDGISKTTREEIRNLVELAFEDQFTVQELADEVLAVLGDGDSARAEAIARTETIRAANAGQQETWDQAVTAGLLNGDEKQVWIVTPDDALCPICEGLDGDEAPLGGTFNADGDDIDGPPAHPNCRCALGLTL